MRPALLISAVAALLTSCATPEARLRSGLENAGLSPTMSACMAERMVDRLSLLQLRRIADLPQARGSESTEQLLHRVRALRDGEILRVTSGAAAACAVRGVLS